MKALFALVLLSGPLFAGEETSRGAGGCLEELRAVLELDGAQEAKVQQALRAADADHARLVDAARQKGADPSIDELLAWQDRLRAQIREVLKPEQLTKYGAWLDRKRRLGEEWDKALFGLPTVTEIKLRLGLGVEALAEMQKQADEGIGRLRAKILEMRTAGASQAEIGAAVNEIRRDTILKMIGATSNGEEKRLREFLKVWLRSPAEKLTRGETERLDRVMKGLEIPEGPLEARVRSLTTAILWHLEENGVYRRGLGKELLLMILRSRADAEVWTAIHEYGTLSEIHLRRVRMLREDLKELLNTKQVAKLVAEGVIE